jgi:hypothetical protein
LSQTVGAGRFLFGNSPTRAHYAEHIRGVNPVAGAVFDALPTASAAIRGSAVAAPAALLNAIQNGRDEDRYRGF